MLIETVEQLDALPEGAMIRDHMEDAHYKDEGEFFECGYHSPDVRSPQEMVRDVGGSFTVIHPRQYDDRDEARVTEAVEKSRYAGAVSFGRTEVARLHATSGEIARAALGTIGKVDDQ